MTGVFLACGFGPCLSAQQPLLPDGIPRATRPNAVAEQPDLARVHAPRWRLAAGIELPHDEILRQMVVPEKVVRQLELLGSPEWSVREAASLTLYEMEIADEILLATLVDQGLGVEQRSRMIATIARRITEAPRGAVGIRMRRNLGGDPGVVVEAVIAGMPGEKFLKAGDRINAIDGMRISTSDDLTSLVQGRQPGDMLVFEVARKVLDGRGMNKLDARGAPLTEAVVVEFPLGSVADLDKSGGVSSSSRVLTSRARLVEKIRSRFGPLLIKIRTDDVVLSEEAYSNRNPDSHPSVAWLIQQLAVQQQVDDAFSLTLRQEISRRYVNLIAESEDETNSPSERKWLKRVLSRYQQLLPNKQ